MEASDSDTDDESENENNESSELSTSHMDQPISLPDEKPSAHAPYEAAERHDEDMETITIGPRNNSTGIFSGGPTRQGQSHGSLITDMLRGIYKHVFWLFTSIKWYLSNHW